MSINANYLLCGSGGGGGGNGGGGGSGGEVIEGTLSVTGSYPVTIGATTSKGDFNVNGSSGNDSTFNGLTAEGGGYGGASNQAGESVANGGGGGANGSGGIGSTGFNGGAGNAAANNNYGGGGGGGGSQDGYASLSSLGANKSRGGEGVTSSISGTPQVYGSGGGGGGYAPYGAAAGPGGTNAGNGTTSGNGTDGTDGYGGGGGGGQGAFSATSAGGRGTFIIAYLTADAVVEGTGGTITYAGGYTIHTFSADGTFVSPQGDAETFLGGISLVG